ncbi:hypothetical protein FC81_GL001714 [Liquorilactobacillus capillatus DSM 19910]|uniref:Uncharacterized protein n=1 Tax=Liquorilactobacillus capillatus DSM 19910 TaxID=1423731 RepID=A0A0R1LZD1_9LACO|nr:hypothetical protein FC81_GL001714 [Liquorilactobacillus capillatus DSM 19910]
MSARLVFVLWSFGTALFNETLIFHFFYASSSSSRYAKIKAALALWQVLLTLIGFYVTSTW